MGRGRASGFFDALKSRRHVFSTAGVTSQFRNVDKVRIETLSGELCKYIAQNLPAAFEKRSGISDYRTNPYVLMTAASAAQLGEATSFAAFLFNSKLYMGLETSFGKSIEAAFVKAYPIGNEQKWQEPPEKLAESVSLQGLSREDKAKARVSSVWREIDKSVVVGKRRYLTSIKSGPNTINDTQVQGMTQAIIANHKGWLAESAKNYPYVSEIDVVLGLTYGTDKTTNNKENQVLVKLLDNGFVEEDRERLPGVLIDTDSRRLRVYRRIGIEFWDFIGAPQNPGGAPFVYLEILLALSRALRQCMKEADLTTRINIKMQELAQALAKLSFGRDTLPEWVQSEFNAQELFWFTTAMTAFYDEGI